jgi:hypothetical protein
MHFNAPPFSADKTCLSQRSEVLRERGQFCEHSCDAMSAKIATRIGSDKA